MNIMVNVIQIVIMDIYMMILIISNANVNWKSVLHAQQ